MNSVPVEKISVATGFLVVLVSYFWGTGIVGSKLALRFLPPFLYSGFRYLIASLILLTLLRLTSKETPGSIKDCGRLAMLGLMHTTGLYGFVYLGMDYITAGKTIVILNSQPFWVALFAPFFLMERRFNLAKAGGLALGFLGVVTIFLTDILKFSPADLKGGALVLMAALSWSAGTIYAKRLMIASSSLLVVSTQMFFGSIPLMVLGQLVPSPARTGVTLEVAALVVGLVLLCSCLPYLVWFRLLQRHPSALLSSFNFLQIIFNVAMAYPVLGEVPGNSLILGAIFVCLGIFVVNRF